MDLEGTKKLALAACIINEMMLDIETYHADPSRSYKDLTEAYSLIVQARAILRDFEMAKIEAKIIEDGKIGR